MPTRPILAAILLGAALLVAGCGDRFSPDVYATRAVQQADKVEQGIIVGVRQVRVSAEGSTGAAAGAAAGGVIGAQAPGGGIISALGGVGGALVGGLLGKGAEHTVVDSNAYEYIVRTSRNELMRVTQQDREPLQRGQQVLLIMGSQARVVPDYTLPGAAGPTAQSGQAPATRAPDGGAAAAGETGPLPWRAAEVPGHGEAPADPAAARTIAPAGAEEPEAIAARALGAAAATALLPAERRGAAVLPPLPGYPPLPPAPPSPRSGAE